MKKLLVNKKLLLGLATMLLVFAIIVVSSFWPFILDPTRILTTEFLSNELVITAIVLASTISMLFVAQASNASNPQSEIARAKVEFKNSMERIKNHTAFFQWVKQILQVKDKKEIAEREMAKLLLPYEIYNMTESEILSLVEAQKIGDKFYGPYPLEKLKKVLKLKVSIAKIKFVSPNYYTSIKSIESDKTLSEIAKNENYKKIFTIVVQLTFKIIMTWLIASIMGSLVRDLAQEGGSTAQTWMTFLSRSMAFGSSSFLGYTIGCKLNDLDAFYILKRVEAHTLYLEDKDFVPVDESKEAFKKKVQLLSYIGDENGEQG